MADAKSSGGANIAAIDPSIALEQKLLEISNLLIEESNGKSVYSNERAMHGFVEPAAKMRIIEDQNYQEPPNLDLKFLGRVDAIQSHLGPDGDAWRAGNPYTTPKTLNSVDSIKHVLINALPLLTKVDPLSIEDAVAAALLRTRWLSTGCLYRTLVERCVTFDEIVVVLKSDPIAVCRTLKDINALADANVKIILAFMISEQGKAMATWIVGNAELVWNMSEHLVRTRGHHWKTEYQKMVEKMYKSSSADNVDWPNFMKHDICLRLAIHPFGIKVLAVIAYRNAWWGLVGNGMLKRITGASNGYAAATTAYAGLSMLTSEPFWTQFYELYKTQIMLVTKFAQIMLDDRYSFHESASLYGLNPRRDIVIDGAKYSMTDVDAAVTAIAPSLQGFINWSNEQAKMGATAVFAFANARVLEKRSSNNPIAVKRMHTLLDASVEHIAGADTTQAAITEAFPALMNA